MAILHTECFGSYFDGTLLAHIMQKNNAEILSILQNATDACQLSDRLGNTLLHYAAEYGNNEFAQYLIDLGAAVDAQNQKHQTPLFFAVEGGKKDTARLLVEANADLFLRDINGQCPLARAFSIRLYIAIALLDKVTVHCLKTNIEYVKSQEFHRDCGLYHFMRLKNTEITRMLLESGSPVNAKSRLCHETALHVAAENLDPDNVKLLIEFKADVNAEMWNGETPLARIPSRKERTQSKEREEADHKALVIVKVLLAAGAVFTNSVSPKLMPRWLLMFGNREMIHTLLQGPIDVAFIDDYKDTFLHVLAMNKHPDILEEVQDLESASKVRNAYGYTMLHKAARSGNVSGMKHLLKNGADVNAKDLAGRTPLSSVLAVPWFSEKDDDDSLDNYSLTVEFLLEHGAHPRLNPPSWEINRFKDNYDLLRKPVLAQMALLEASDQRIERSLHDAIESRCAYKKIFDLMKNQLDEMKEITIEKSATLFDFLIASDEKISLYARNNISITNLAETIEEDYFDSYYRRILRKQFVKFEQLIETRQKVAFAINEIFNVLFNISVYIVAEQIVTYLDDKELYIIVSISK